MGRDSDGTRRGLENPKVPLIFHGVEGQVRLEYQTYDLGVQQT